MSEPIKAPRLLEKSVVPMSPSIGDLGMGVHFLPRADKILRHLAASADEREYQRMIDTEDAISSAIEQRVSGLLEDGWEFLPGRADSRNAQMFADFAGAFLKAPEIKFPIVLREMLEAIFLGWRPCETLWHLRKYEGSVRLVPKRIICHDPWRFRFTVDGDLALIHRSQLQIRLFRLDQPVERLRWQIATAGSTKTPYGKSWLQRMWLLWFVAKEFSKMSEKAISRALGVFRAKRTGGHAKLRGSDSTVLQSLPGELVKAMEILDSNGVLVELSDYSLDSLDLKVDLVGNLETLWKYFDDKFRIGIVGQTLTSSQGKIGSQALGREHRKVLESFWRADGRQLTAWMATLLQVMIDSNWGEQAPDEYPVFALRAFSKPNLPGVALYLNAGGKVDARRFAEELNVPAIFDESEDDVVLQRVPGSGEITMPGSERDEGRERRPTARAADDSRQASLVDGLLSGEGIGPSAVQTLYEGAVSRLLADNRDPD
jgi:hypothetical protein